MTRDGPPRTRGLLLAAPSSASGKTVVTLGLLRALSDRGVAVAAAKSGPDYIDPQFLAAAARGCCVNLDAWAMSTERLRALASRSDLLLVEGAMGLFDGAPPNGRGSAGDLAAKTGAFAAILDEQLGRRIDTLGNN